MKRLYVLVEGQTEEAIIKEVLSPHLQNHGLWTHVLIVETSRAESGKKQRGGGKWRHWRNDLRRLMKEQGSSDVRFTSMIDLYGLPSDFPGLSQHASIADTVRRADLLEASMSETVGDHRFIPNIQRHETEALVLAALDSLRSLLDNATDLDGLVELEASVSGIAPEDINDGPSSSPAPRAGPRSPVDVRPAGTPRATPDHRRGPCVRWRPSWPSARRPRLALISALPSRGLEQIQAGLSKPRSRQSGG